MKAPASASIIENEDSLLWFENNIVYYVAKKGAVISKQTISALMLIISSHGQGEKVCWICDVSEASMPANDVINFAVEETIPFIKALAFITPTNISKRIADMYLLVKKPAFPVKVFILEEEAKAWVSTFLLS